MPKYYAFEVHCEELLDPPVLAVVVVTMGDYAMLQAYRTLFLASKTENQHLASMSFTGPAGLVAWFPEDAVPQAITDKLRAGDGRCELTDDLVKSLHVQEERQVEDVHLHVDDRGSWFTAAVQPSEIVVSVGVLFWEDLQKDLPT